MDGKQQDGAKTPVIKQEGFCQAHGLHYDPLVESGCVICRRKADTGTPPASAILERSVSNRKEMWASILFAAVLVPVAVWSWSSNTAPLEENSFVEREEGFAIAAPKEWVRFTPQNIQAALQVLGDRVVPNLKSLGSSSDVKVGYAKIVPPGAFAPSVNVVVLKGRPPEINEKTRDEAMKEIGTLFKQHLPNYQLERAEIVEVDRLKAIMIVGNSLLRVVEREAERAPAVSSGRSYMKKVRPAVIKEYKLKTTQYMVPGSKHSYIISFTGEVETAFTDEPSFHRILGSFRVLDRPARLGRFLHYTISGAALGSLISAFVYMLMAFISRRK